MSMLASFINRNLRLVTQALLEGSEGARMQCPACLPEGNDVLGFEMLRDDFDQLWGEVPQIDPLVLCS